MATSGGCAFVARGGGCAFVARGDGCAVVTGVEVVGGGSAVEVGGVRDGGRPQQSVEGLVGGVAGCWWCWLVVEPWR